MNSNDGGRDRSDVQSTGHTSGTTSADERDWLTQHPTPSTTDRTGHDLAVATPAATTTAGVLVLDIIILGGQESPFMDDRDSAGSCK